MTALTNIKSISNRFKNFLLATAFVATQVVAPLSLSGVARAAGDGNPTPPGNNGTLKVHEKNTPSGTENEDPKVCAFNFEGFGFDVGQEGYIRIDGQGQTQGSYGDYSFGPTTPDAQHTSYAQSQYFNDGGVTIPDGQYKATLYGKDAGGSIDLQDDKAKSKVFKVQCEQPVVKPCEVYTSAGEVRPSNLMGFDFSETRATGHYEFIEDGLHIWTEGATSTDKVAAYKSVNVPLSDVGDLSIDYDSTFGIDPGYQLVVDFDNNGTPDGILVGEPDFYGNDWWLTNSAAQFVKDGAPSHSGGSGSANHGTLNQWLSAFPNAQVQAFGFSLGSGVHADGVLKSITFNCGVYTFTNDKGRIEIVKDAQPNSLQDFTFNTTGSGLSDFTLDDDFGVPGKSNANSKTKVFEGLAANTYTVTEAPTTGWYLDSVTCNEHSYTSLDGLTVTINLRADEHVKCTFVNKRLTKIIVHKVTDPRGDQTSFPVSIHADNGEVVGETTGSISSGSDATFWVKPGKYDVDESKLPAGWKQTWTTCQNLEVTGEHSTKECTIYNEKLTGLTIIKDAQPDSTKDFHFTVFTKPFIGLPHYFDSFTLDDDGNANNTHSNQQNYTDLKSGWYIVNEQNTKGWSLEDVSCSEGTQFYRLFNTLFVKVDKNQMPVCTFVNERNTGSLTVNKHALPNDEKEFGFTIEKEVTCQPDLDVRALANIAKWQTEHECQTIKTVSEFGLSDTADPDPKSASHTEQLAPGRYRVTEDINSAEGWKLTDINCGEARTELDENTNSIWVYVEKGAEVSCTFTNTKLAKVTVVKDAQPNSLQSFTFTSDLTGENANFNLVDDGDLPGVASKSFTGLMPGTYHISEAATSGWTLKDIDCGDVTMTQDGSGIALTVEAGDDITCTFVNAKKPAGQVLGASTELPNTGQNPLASVAAGLMIIALAFAARWFGRKPQSSTL